MLLALSAAAGWGTADFLAGTAARRDGSVLRVTVTVYAAGTLVMLALCLCSWQHHDEISGAAMLWGAISGIGSGAGALFLVAGFRRAPFSVAAPLSALIGAGLPVVAGVALGERPAGMAWAGVALAFPAIALVSASSGRRGERGGTAGIALGLAAGIGCGISLAALAKTNPAEGLWPLLFMQAAALMVTLAVAVLSGNLGWPSARSRVLSGASGITSALSAVWYLAAVHAGLLTVVAVVTSLFPAATVTLAWACERERLGRMRLAGLLVAAVSISLIAASGTTGQHAATSASSRHTPARVQGTAEPGRFDVTSSGVVSASSGQVVRRAQSCRGLGFHTGEKPTDRGDLLCPELPMLSPAREVGGCQLARLASRASRWRVRYTGKGIPFRTAGERCPSWSRCRDGLAEWVGSSWASSWSMSTVMVPISPMPVCRRYGHKGSGRGHDIVRLARRDGVMRSAGPTEEEPAMSTRSAVLLALAAAAPAQLGSAAQRPRGLEGVPLRAQGSDAHSRAAAAHRLVAARLGHRLPTGTWT